MKSNLKNIICEVTQIVELNSKLKYNLYIKIKQIVEYV